MRGAALLKSGTMNGLASWAETTDCGTTRRSVGCSALNTGSASGSGSSPPAVSMSRLIRLVASPMTASSWSSEKSDGSRAAVLARIVATPSSRLRKLSRWASLRLSSARTRARSSRASSATAWNRARWPEVSCRRSTACSTSRTALASSGMTPSFCCCLRAG